MRHNYKIILANINAILLIAGYPLFTSIVFDSDFEKEGTRAYSIVYRGLALIFALLTIIAHGIRRPRSLDAGIVSFFILWILYACRVIYDLFLRSESYLISEPNKQFLFLFIFGGVLIPTIAFFSSRNSLDFEKIFKWLFFLLIFVILKWFFSDRISSNTGRVDLNIAVSTLGLGSLGAILSLQSFIIITHNMRFKKIAWVTFLLGLSAVGNAGSRGSFVALLVVLCCYLLTRKISKLIIIAFVLIVLLYFLRNTIIDLLNTFYPVLMQRMESTVNELDTGGRDVLFAQAVKQFIDNPFFGDWFLLDHGSVASYPHNAIIEGFSSLGIFGGISAIVLYIALIIKALKILKYNSYLSFYACLCLFFIFYSVTTGGSVLKNPDFDFAFLSILIINTKNSIRCESHRDTLMSTL
jgi:O-antigen ligase